ncbi:MAG: F0F1 ATP synthase subunit delta [Myxococcales bacterium]|nr:F0F1 ATP synthase subunit delta [Myxococcales bacterium]
MNIDWFTVGAQIVNFLILIALLKRFLYQPLLTAMDKREQTIAARWEEAEHTKNEAQSLLEENERQRKELRDTKESSLTKIREEAETQKQHLLQEVRTDIQQRKEQWRKSLEREQEDFLRDLQRRVGQETLAIARRALQDLADTELEQAVARTFLQKLQSLTAEEKQTLSEAIQESDLHITLQSSFPLAEEQKQQIAEELHQLAQAQVQVETQEDPDLLCGILLKAEQYQLSWHLRQYLETLSQRFLETLSDSNREAQAS